MNSLLNSGNLVGYLGLALIIFVGFRLGRQHQAGGWVLGLGAMLFLLSQLFSTYVAPRLAEAVLVSFSRTTIVMLSTLPVVTLVLGFVLIPLGLLLLSLGKSPEARLHQPS